VTNVLLVPVVKYTSTYIIVVSFAFLRHFLKIAGVRNPVFCVRNPVRWCTKPCPFFRKKAFYFNIIAASTHTAKHIISITAVARPVANINSSNI